jgi:hypothetical protein
MRVSTPSDPAQALIKRYTAWERRLENLMELFTQIQKFQKEHSKHYHTLSEIAGQSFPEGEGFTDDSRGVLSIWEALKEKSTTLARFHDGLHDSYNDHVVRELKNQLEEVRQFKKEMHRLRTREGAKVVKKQRRFFESVTDLKLSVNRLRIQNPSDDPFIRNRSKSLV